MNVKKIVAQWLKEHGFDGLCNEDNWCACADDDLLNCCENTCLDCEPGYKIKVDPTKNLGYDYDIVKEKP